MAQDVLIVEDDQALAAALVRSIEGEGYGARLASDGVEAIAAIRAERPDLILLDLLLPKKDGRAVLASLKASADTRDIPVVAMSGIFRGRSHARDLEEAGAMGFLEKPFSPSDLLAHLHALIGPPSVATSRASASPRQPLSETPVAEVLWSSMAAGFTGAVQFQAGKVHKVVLLEDGFPRSIRSNATRECLGQRLLQAGRIGKSELEGSLERARSEQVPQGRALVELGALSEEEVEAELAAQSEEKLLELFGWDDGEAWSQADVKNISFASALSGWTPAQLILRGVERMPVHRALARLSAFVDCEPVIEELRLADDERELCGVADLLASIQPGTTLAGLLDDHAPALYALWVMGALQLSSKADEAASAKGSAPQSDPAADKDARVEEFQAILGRLESQDHFEALSLARDVRNREVRSAFLSLAKKYHPDRLRSAPEAARAGGAEIFARLSQAHEILSDPAARREYERELAGGPTAEDRRREVAKILTAEQEFNAGEVKLRGRDFAAAHEHFRRALELDPGAAEFHALYGWAHFLANRDDEAACRLAREHLEKALSLAPEGPTGYYYMGQIRKACGELPEAKTMFRKVLELRPDHLEAERELRLFAMRQGKPAEKARKASGGLFGFRRKK